MDIALNSLEIVLKGKRPAASAAVTTVVTTDFIVDLLVKLGPRKWKPGWLNDSADRGRSKGSLSNQTEQSPCVVSILELGAPTGCWFTERVVEEAFMMATARAADRRDASAM